MYELSTGTRVLLVEDDEIIREIVAAHLASQGADTTVVSSQAEAIAEYSMKRFDLVIADINLPDGLGFDMVESLRTVRDCAVIYMTSRGTSDDRVRGLDTGDDYVVKPVDLPELSARIKAVLRRYRKAPTPATQVIAVGNWTLDLVRRELADSSGHVLALTRGEFDMFAALVQASPTPLAREYLVEVVASAEATTHPRTIDVMVSRVRTKLETRPHPLQIKTVRGAGYRFVSPAT